ncbi:MAG: type II toxin-antitoxin system RelE/ParE family toxin [Alphaproteobacteria bacterium]|nr:type II toxin-antitoxin system RelE/ParE family toxin [Alphaproteobacteria bacterium]
MKVRWLRVALAQLEREAVVIAGDDPKAAAAMLTRVFEAAEGLAQFPAMGRVGRVAGTREQVVPGTPYILPYRVREQQVEILRFLHGARKWPP